MKQLQEVKDKFPDLFARFDTAFDAESKRMENALRDDFPDCRFERLRAPSMLLIIHNESGKRLPLDVRQMEPFGMNDNRIEWARQIRQKWLSR